MALRYRATGETEHEAGMLGLVNLGFRMPDYSHHLCHTLYAAGYRTVLAGLQHIAPDAHMIGFDQMLPHKACALPTLLQARSR